MNDQGGDGVIHTNRKVKWNLKCKARRLKQKQKREQSSKRA